MGSTAGSGPVLHPTDFSDGARAAHPYSVYLAGLLGVDLHVLHVEEPGAEETVQGDPTPPRGAGDPRSWLAATTALESNDKEEAELPEVRRRTRRGSEPAEAIVAYADQLGAGAICMGTHGRSGVRRLVFGSVTEEVLRQVRCPVLTVRRGIPGWGEDGPRRLLAAVDLSPMTEPTLAWAGLTAAATGARLTAVHVATTHAAGLARERRQQIHSAFESLDFPDVDLQTEFLPGDPATRIRDLAEEEGADMVVTATHGRSGPARLVLGSVAEALVRRAPCPVLTVTEPPPSHREGQAEG